MNITKTSKFLSLILRHKPEAGGITLDKNGWASVFSLLNACNIKIGQLDKIVSENNKGRFEYDEKKTKIRARQGHSIKVDVGLSEQIPPEFLYHGTKYSNLSSIKDSGLLKMNRLHVHLSIDKNTAIEVAKRRSGKSVVLKIDALKMQKDGYSFFLSNNNVWLTDSVPSKYILHLIWIEGVL